MNRKENYACILIKTVFRTLYARHLISLKNHTHSFFSTRHCATRPRYSAHNDTSNHSYAAQSNEATWTPMNGEIRPLH